MKIKKLIAAVLALTLCVAMAACTTPETDPTKATEATQPGKDSSIVMSDSFTFSDPTDLDFDARYVYFGDETSTVISNMAAAGYKALKMFEVLYTKEGKVAGEYQFFVCADEEAAKAVADFYKLQGMTLEQSGAVVYMFNNADTVEALIMTYAGMGMLADEKVETYLAFLSQFNGLTEYKG